MANLKTFCVSSGSSFLNLYPISTPVKQERPLVDIWLTTLIKLEEDAIDKRDALSADMVYQRILDGKEEVYSSEEARKFLELDD